MVTQARLKELFDYNPATGEFVRILNRPGPKARPGSVAGYLDEKGYTTITVDGIQYRAHQLAWMYVYGEWPSDHMDHENGVRSDNRIQNIRVARQADNNKNRKNYKSNTSGLKGVSFYRPNGKWKAQIQCDGKKVGLGYFESKELAGAAYQAAAAYLFGEFARAA